MGTKHLTDQEVWDIQQAFLKRPHHGQTVDLAKKYDVSPRTILNARTRFVAPRYIGSLGTVADAKPLVDEGEEVVVLGAPLPEGLQEQYSDFRASQWGDCGPITWRERVDSDPPDVVRVGTPTFIGYRKAW